MSNNSKEYAILNIKYCVPDRQTKQIDYWEGKTFRMHFC